MKNNNLCKFKTFAVVLHSPCKWLEFVFIFKILTSKAKLYVHKTSLLQILVVSTFKKRDLLESLYSFSNSVTLYFSELFYLRLFAESVCSKAVLISTLQQSQLIMGQPPAWDRLQVLSTRVHIGIVSPVHCWFHDVWYTHGQYIWNSLRINRFSQPRRIAWLGGWDRYVVEFLAIHQKHDYIKERYFSYL